MLPNTYGDRYETCLTSAALFITAGTTFFMAVSKLPEIAVSKDCPAAKNSRLLHRKTAMFVRRSCGIWDWMYDLCDKNAYESGRLSSCDLKGLVAIIRMLIYDEVVLWKDVRKVSRGWQSARELH